jgi:hypothetical protein
VAAQLPHRRPVGGTRILTRRGMAPGGQNSGSGPLCVRPSGRVGWVLDHQQTGAQVRPLAHGLGDDPCWDRAADSAVLRAVDALHAQSDLADEQWDGLVAATGEDGALEAVLLCGWYHTISFAARALLLLLEPGTAGFPAA